MDRVLIVTAVLIGLYALHVGQAPGQRAKLALPVPSVVSLKATAGGSVGAAAAGMAGRIVN